MWYHLTCISDMSPTPEELAERSELQQAIQHAILTLPHAYRSIVLLCYREQLSFTEIGRILHIHKSTVKTRYNRAKPLLALPHQESDFVFFKLHTFSGSFLRFHGIPPLH